MAQSYCSGDGGGFVVAGDELYVVDTGTLIMLDFLFFDTECDFYISDMDRVEDFLGRHVPDTQVVCVLDGFAWLQERFWNHEVGADHDVLLGKEVETVGTELFCSWVAGVGQGGEVLGIFA